MSNATALLQNLYAPVHTKYQSQVHHGNENCDISARIEHLYDIINKYTLLSPPHIFPDPQKAKVCMKDLSDISGLLEYLLTVTSLVRRGPLIVCVRTQCSTVTGKPPYK